jgi:hypothetical protein
VKHGDCGKHSPDALLYAQIGSEWKGQAEHEVCNAPKKISSLLGLLLSNVISPGPKGLYNLGEDGCGKWYPHEYEGFVDNVCEAELGPDRWVMVS